MAISFSCPACGRAIEAPDEAEGQSLSCPGCESSVTCPEPVYDAELVEPPPAGSAAIMEFNPIQSVVIAATAVQVAPRVAAEERRPCPICGERIIATAAKCRFCGEILDAALVRSVAGAYRGSLASVATVQQILLVGVAVQVLLFLYVVVNAFTKVMEWDQNASASLSIVYTYVCAALVVAYIATTVFTFLLAIKVSGVEWGIVLGLLSMVPGLGLLISLLVNQRATSILKENGYKVGLLGARKA